MSPAARKSLGELGSGTPRVSPRRNPASSARSTGCRCVGAREHERAQRVGGARERRAGGSATPSRSVAWNSPTACFHRQRRSKPSSSANQPRSTHRLPRRRAAAAAPATSPDAVDEHRAAAPASRPSSESTRTSTRASNRLASGSSTSVASTRGVAVLRDRPRVSGDAPRPCSARCITATPSSADRERRRSAARERGRTHAHARRRPPRRRRAAATAAPGAHGLAREDARDQRHEHDERARPGRGRRRHRGQTVTSGARSAKRLSPMPRTLRRSFTDVKPPRRCRSAMIDCAYVGPMPGSSSSCACVAVLRLTLPPGRTRRRARRPSAPPAPGSPTAPGSPDRPWPRRPAGRRRPWPRGSGGRGRRRRARRPPPRPRR